MKTIKSFSIELDNNRTTFVPGQKVEGHVSLILNEPLKVQLVRVRFMGSINAQMYKNDSSNRVVSTIFKEISTIFGAPFSEAQAEELESGEHIFPYVFRVPPVNLPCSYQTHKKFNGPKGRIKYELTAVLVRPNTLNKTCSTVITIPSSLDTSDEEYSEPVEREVTEDAGGLILKRGNIFLKASIPKAAFYPESTVPVTISIINQSGTPIILNGVSIKQKVMFRSFTEERGPLTERIHILQYKEAFPSSLRDIKRIVNINIPPMNVISSSINTTILDVLHSLCIKVQTCSEDTLRSMTSGPKGYKSSPILRKLKLDALSQRFLSQKVKLELPLIIGGFPFMLLDSLPDRTSMETLPMYERRSSDEYFDTDRAESSERSSESSIVHLSQSASEIQRVEISKEEQEQPTLDQDDHDSEFTNDQEVTPVLSTEEV